MGKLESEARFQRRKGYLQSALLSAVAISGLLLVGAAAPNVLQLIEKLPGSRYKFNYRMKTVAGRLVERGLVKFTNRDGKKYMEITPAGTRELFRTQEENVLHERARKRWDKRWRMVVFDIPEKYRATRDKLRLTLRSLGFVQLQASVWVYPYDCEDLIVLLKADFRIGKDLLYIIADTVENDSVMKKEFGLV